MFVRPCWEPISSQDAHSLIKEHPWALLVSNGKDGPFATNLPLLIDSFGSKSGSPLVLVGHMARANAHSEQLGDPSATFLAIFEGPWSYVTASWYPSRDMPSTYYYTAVHCYGTIELQNESELDSSVEDLTQRMESHHPNGWSTKEISREAITRRFAGIVGFRLRLMRMEAKFKLGQDEPLRDALAVADVLESRGTSETLALAKLIRKQNSARTP